MMDRCVLFSFGAYMSNYLYVFSHYIMVISVVYLFSLKFTVSYINKVSTTLGILLTFYMSVFYH